MAVCVSGAGVGASGSVGSGVGSAAGGVIGSIRPITSELNLATNASLSVAISVGSTAPCQLIPTLNGEAYVLFFWKLLRHNLDSF